MPELTSSIVSSRTQPANLLRTGSIRSPDVTLIMMRSALLAASALVAAEARPALEKPNIIM